MTSVETLLYLKRNQFIPKKRKAHGHYLNWACKHYCTLLENPQKGKKLKKPQNGKKRKVPLVKTFNPDQDELDYLQRLAAPPYPSTLAGLEFLLQFPVRVKSTLFSGDDRSFSPLENSFCREWAFYVPLFKASSLSGLFRQALLNLTGSDLSDSKKKKQFFRLMGHTGSTDPAMELFDYSGEGLPPEKGWMRFYPLYFDRVHLEMITPLNRETRFPPQGQGPIMIEGIPENCTALLSVGYFPMDAGLDVKAALDDFETICKTLNLLIFDLGLGAKRSSGFGELEAEDKISLFLGSGYSPHDEQVLKTIRESTLPVKNICVYLP